MCDPLACVPSVEDDLLLVERVFLRIGSAASDKELEDELQKLLPPLIQKLTSPHESVRKKVMELLIHINRRVKDHQTIQLPVEALLNQYQNPNATSFVTNFSIIYIKMGFPRLDVNKQVELLPELLHSLDGKASQQQDSILNLMIPIFAHIQVKDGGKKHGNLLGLDTKPALSKLLLDYMLDLLLLPYGVMPPSQRVAAAEGVENNEEGDGVPVPGIPPGMSVASFKRVAGDTPPRPETLEALKLSAVKFLTWDVLAPNLVIIPLIVAAADTRYSVANAAELHLWRIAGAVDWNTNSLIAALYVLFLGTLTPRTHTPPDKFRNPTTTRIRLKLMPYLLKSRDATGYAPMALKVFYECLWGAGGTNGKLRHFGVSFVHHVAFTAQAEKVAPVGGALLNGVVRVIEEEKADPRLRSKAYGALAKLSVKLPELMLSHTSQLHYLQTLMDALIHEEGDTILAVQEALSMVAPICRQLSPTSRDQLCILLLDHVMHTNAQLRRTAVNYAATVFPNDHVASRFILMVATGDSHDDLRFEAKRQLYKPVSELSDGTQQKFQTPSFSAVIGYVVERVNALPRTRWIEVNNQLIPFSMPVVEEILKYLEHCLSVEATQQKQDTTQLFWVDSSAVGKLVRKIDSEMSKKQKAIQGESKGFNPFLQLFGFAEMAANAWSCVALKCIVRVVAVAPDLLVSHYSERLDWIRKFIMRGGQYGEVAAHLYGLVLSQITRREDFEKAFGAVRNTKSLRPDVQECCVLAQGYSFSYFIHAKLKCNTGLSDWPVMKDALSDMVSQLMSESTGPLQAALVTAIGEVARFSALPLVHEAATSTDEPSLLCLVETLIKIFGDKKVPSKIREQAVATAGYLCVGQPDFPYKKMIMEAFLALGKETNEIEIHFGVGEALTDCILGHESISALNEWMEKEAEESNVQEKASEEPMEKDSLEKFGDEEPMEVTTCQEEDHLSWLLNDLLRKCMKETQPSVRQASCIWLLSVLKKCRRKSVVLRQLTLIQTAFMNLLGDTNDLIQDAASKGLGVIYECCSEETRQEMVENLVTTLTEGKRVARNVTDDTKIFQEGELGAAPSGGQISTYRELCSLATDLNQPDLVYKFMNLANHNAVWNSKKGAAFGFSTLASQAGAQLEPYLPQIIPKLYRYQHDPTPRIQQTMTSIWSALVTDTPKTIEKYYDAILQDLLCNLTDKLWRVRESCCHALSDLLRRQPITCALTSMAEMWLTLSRVRDDIKESVRLAADKTLNSLSKCCIKVCEGSESEGQKVLAHLLPVLLTSGITSVVPEVRAVSVTTVVKVCRTGGPLVRPHLGALIPALLEALSGLEATTLNYVSVRLSDEDREKLDHARLSLVKASPVMDTLNYVLQFVDDAILNDVVAGLLEVLRGSLGLNSRAGAAHVVETLTHTCPGPLEKHTGKILTVLVNGLIDRNVVVRKVYANAIGNLVRTAKPSSVEKLLSKLQSWYLEKEDDSLRHTAAMTMRSMHTQNGDLMRDHAGQALPLVFLAMHATKTAELDPTGAEIWEEVWSENMPGMEAGVRLYLAEILCLCRLALQSPSWALKCQVGRSLSTVSKQLENSQNELYAPDLVCMLAEGLQGRTWDGKEALATALADVSVACKGSLVNGRMPDSGEPVGEFVVKILVREASKEKTEYKIHALRSLTLVLQAFQIDRFEEVLDICIPFFAQDSETKEETEEVVARDDKSRWELIDEMINSLGRAWPSGVDTQGVAKFYSLRRESLVVLNELLESVKDSAEVSRRLGSELQSAVEEARRDPQPDVQALATSAHRVLINSMDRQLTI